MGPNPSVVKTRQSNTTGRVTMAAEDVLTPLTVVTATRRRIGSSVPYLLFQIINSSSDWRRQEQRGQPSSTTTCCRSCGREQTLIRTLVGEATELKMKRPLHSVSQRISCSNVLGIRFPRAGGPEFGSPLFCDPADRCSIGCDHIHPNQTLRSLPVFSALGMLQSLRWM
ncbi:unnamed protein product [Arctogadus glacialis]